MFINFLTLWVLDLCNHALVVDTLLLVGLSQHREVPFLLVLVKFISVVVGAWRHWILFVSHHVLIGLKFYRDM